AAGPMLIPGTHYMVGGGKQGILYVLDRGNLGHLDATKAWGDTEWSKVHANSTMADFLEDFSADHVVQKLRVGFQQYIPDNPTYLATPGAPLAAVKQLDNQLDVFVVGNDGGIYVSWVIGDGAWAGPARITPTNLAPPGACLALAHQTDN